MVMPNPPNRGDRALPDVDEYLNPEQETQLRTSTSWVAWHWQREHGCDDFDCLRCRVGRALAVLSKAVMDANASADILCGLIPDLVEHHDEVEPQPNTEEYQETCRSLIKTLDVLEQVGVNVAIAMRTPTAEVDLGAGAPTRPTRRNREVN